MNENSFKIFKICTYFLTSTFESVISYLAIINISSSIISEFCSRVCLAIMAQLQLRFRNRNRQRCQKVCTIKMEQGFLRFVKCRVTLTAYI